MKSSTIGLFTAAGLLILPLLTATVHAQTTTIWNPAANPATMGLWSEAANWTGGVVPDGDYKIVFNVGGAIPCVVNSAATPDFFVMGDGGASPGDAAMIITNGGSMNPTDPGYCAIGYTRNAYLEVGSGASMTCLGHLWVGLLTPAVGTFVMNGGTVTVTGQFGLGWDSGMGYAHINAGTLNLTQWHDTQSVKTGTLNLAGGTVIISGNRTTSVNNYIAGGKITAHGGTGTVNVNYDAGTDKTTLTASGGTTPPSQSITSVTASDGSVTLIYGTTIGFPYHLEVSAALSPASWTTVPGSTTNATDSTTTFTATQSGSPQFYRSVSP